MEINLSRFVVSNIYNRYVCIFYMHSCCSTDHMVVIVKGSMTMTMTMIII